MRISWTGHYKDIDVSDESYRYRKIMGDNELVMKFSLPEFIEFPLGATVTFQNEIYTLYKPQSFNKNHTRDYQYTLTFGASKELLQNYKIRDTSGRLVFPFTGKPQEHLQLIVNILNLNDSGWTVGNYIENVEKLISYNHSNCLDALQSIATEFNTEWEIVGKTIHLQKVEYNKLAPLALSYGKGNGFVSGVGRQNDGNINGFNVLFVQGGDKNIDLSVYGNKNLLLPISQEYIYDGSTYVTDADGLSIVKKDVAITFRKEESLDCSHIYPKRTGSVSQFITNDLEKHFYDFEDASIPETLDFNQYMLNGETLTILFESGMLSGREFECNYFHADRRFEIVPQDLDGITMPDETFKAIIGDKYSVYGMMLPIAYISDNATKTGSSWDMFKEACKYFYENAEAKFTFQGKLDGIWAKQDWLNIGGKIKIGGYIRFSDTIFQPTGIDIRIVGVKDYINNPHSPEVELANSVQGSNILSELGHVGDTNEVVTNTLHQSAIDFTKRRYRDVIETIAMLEAAQLGFEESINPITVNTMSLLLGDNSLQYRFVNSTVSPAEVEHVFSYDTFTKVFSTLGGIIQHMTLEITDLKPEQTYKFWNVELFTSATLTDITAKYYFYAKVSKTEATGIFLLSETSIALEEVVGYYHLLVGVLNSENIGDRSFARMFGFTEILPGQIKVDTLSSGNGRQQIKLLSDRIKLSSGNEAQQINLLEDKIEINADVTFSEGSPAFKQIDDGTDIGGRNLIVKSSEDNLSYYVEQVYLTPKNYVFSAEINHNVTINANLIIVAIRISTGTYEVIAYSVVAIIANEVTRVKCLLNNVNLSLFDNFVFKLQDVNEVSIAISKPKLEIGNKVTDYTPSHADVYTNFGFESYADMYASFLTGKTVIKGGEINTDFLNAVGIMAKFIETEVITAEIAYIKSLGVKHLRTGDTGSRIEATGSSMKYFDANGDLKIEFITDLYGGNAGMKLNGGSIDADSNSHIVIRKANAQLGFAANRLGIFSENVTLDSLNVGGDSIQSYVTEYSIPEIDTEQSSGTYYECNNSNHCNITLPLVSISGRIIIFRKASTGTVAIKGNGKNINGSASAYYLPDNSLVMFIYSGEWITGRMPN